MLNAKLNKPTFVSTLLEYLLKCGYTVQTLDFIFCTVLWIIYYIFWMSLE